MRGGTWESRSHSANDAVRNPCGTICERVLTEPNDVAGARNVGLPVVWFNRRKRPLPAGEAAPKWTVESDAELLALLRAIL